jgi:25S rRNA (uracil2634-N3)-methyltransferase
VGLGIKDQDRNILANQQLILGFLHSAIPLLKHPLGEIHITVKSGAPYDDWNIKSLAKSTLFLKCKEQYPFYPSLYPGYEHRRTLGFVEGQSKRENEELKQCKTMVFVSVDAPDANAKKRKEEDL